MERNVNKMNNFVLFLRFGVQNAMEKNIKCNETRNGAAPLLLNARAHISMKFGGGNNGWRKWLSIHNFVIRSISFCGNSDAMVLFR